MTKPKPKKEKKVWIIDEKGKASRDERLVKVVEKLKGNELGISSWAQGYYYALKEVIALIKQQSHQQP